METKTKETKNEKKNEVKDMAQDTAKAAKTQPQARTAADKADDMRREIERKTKELQDCLKVLERKNELSQMRSVFIDVLDNIGSIKTELDDVTDFETKRYAITFATVGNYDRKAVFSVSNTAILRDFIEFITVRIDKRVKEIEAELIK